MTDSTPKQEGGRLLITRRHGVEETCIHGHVLGGPPVRVDGVGFRYPGGKPILSDVTFEQVKTGIGIITAKCNLSDRLKVLLFWVDECIAFRFLNVSGDF